MRERIPRLLYIDDEPFNLELFQLTFFGSIEVLIASSASDALKILEKDTAIDLVIADLEMPTTSGIEFIKTAKVLYTEIPFYVLSGYDYFEECEELEVVSGFFQKPFKKEEILTLSRKIIKESQREIIR
ncbi:MAG: response regulator [Flavobacteriaceae bacterium]|nr:MAG: response regulator [Flavobacteriaceae bacterium]